MPHLGMTMSVWALAAFLTGAAWPADAPGSAAEAATLFGEPAKVTHDWPCYTGPDGTLADPSQTPLLDDFSRARLVWVSEQDDLGWSKTVNGGGSARYPKTMAPSGGASLIVAQGLVIAAYFHPKNNVVADDVLLALDAANGKVRWKQVFADKGVNSGARNGPQYGATPADAGGKVFSPGSSGRVYAVDLATGKVLWESDLGEIHRNVVDLMAKTPVTEDRYDGLGGARNPVFRSPLTVVDGVAMVLSNGLLFGFDGATGKLLWQIKSAEATPCSVKLNGQTYALTQTEQAMQLIRPQTGQIVWQEKLGYRRFLTPVVADGRAFVPRLKDPTKPAGKDDPPTLAAFGLSETGATLLWQSERLPLTNGSWLACREGVVYGNTRGVSKTDKKKVLTFDAKDGRVLGSYEDETSFKSEFFVWGDRIVLVGDNGHESLGSNCGYTPLTPGVRDLKKAGASYAPRNAPDYMGVCGEGLTMRDAFADGYQFTRAVNLKKAKGAIMCWDLRKTP